MTLIVARITDNQITIIGDTKLTIHKNPNANPYIHGCLKQYILNDTTAIAFAGVQEHFEKIFPTIKKLTSTIDMINAICEAQRAGDDFDIIIADIETTSLVFIKNGVAETSSAGYIGDKDAFEIYQKYMHTKADNPADTNDICINIIQHPEPERAEYLTSFEAFKKTILNKNAATVGGVLVPLCSHNKKFRYMGYAEINSDPILLENIPKNPTPITFGSSENGGYSVEFWSNKIGDEMGIDIGFYCMQGEFGILYKESKSGLKKAHVIKAKNPAYWSIATRKLIGSEIASGYLNIDHCGIAGENFLTEQNYIDAHDCFKLGLSRSMLPKKIADRYTAGYATALINLGHIDRAIKLLNDIKKQSIENPMCHALQKKLNLYLSEQK